MQFVILIIMVACIEVCPKKVGVRRCKHICEEKYRRLQGFHSWLFRYLICRTSKGDNRNEGYVVTPSKDGTCGVMSSEANDHRMLDNTSGMTCVDIRTAFSSTPPSYTTPKVQAHTLLMVAQMSNNVYGCLMKLESSYPMRYRIPYRQVTSMLFLRKESRYLIAMRRLFYLAKKPGLRSNKKRSTNFKFVSDMGADEEKRIVFLVNYNRGNCQIFRMTTDVEKQKFVCQIESNIKCSIEVELKCKQIFVNSNTKLFLLNYEGTNLKTLLDKRPTLHTFTRVPHISTVFFMHGSNLMKLTETGKSSLLLTMRSKYKRNTYFSMIFYSNKLYINSHSDNYIFTVDLSKGNKLVEVKLPLNETFILNLI